MDRVFLDANVLFSALLTSAHAVEEARRNLSDDDQRQRLIGLVRKCEIVTTPTVAGLPEGVVLPPGDRLIFLAAMAAHATHLLTGDRTHFGPYYGRTVAGVLVLPPSAYLRG